MRDAPLTTIKGGINRLRIKGGARADDLYDLYNAYRLDSGRIRVRPGTRRIAKLDSATKGLMSFGGTLCTFCHRAVYVPEGITLYILTRPDKDFPAVGETEAYTVPGNQYPLERIHFAEAFMGAPYVAAEFSDGSIFHYWLQAGEQWAANTEYRLGDIVYPSTPTGLVYRATRLGSANPAWAPNVLRYDGSGGTGYEASIVEPTTYNGFYYVCTATTGVSPRSGTTEPDWPTEDGATVIESTDNPPDVTTPTTIDSTASSTVPTSTKDRYGSWTTKRTIDWSG